MELSDVTTEPGLFDERTREGAECLVLAEVTKEGGFSVFWVTETPKRSAAAQRLVDSGRIVRTGGRYPFCEYHVRAEGKA